MKYEVYDFQCFNARCAVQQMNTIVNLLLILNHMFKVFFKNE